MAAVPSADDYCPCSNILIMQLFHELKQKFPAVPDRVVSECIRQNCHDKRTCEILLRRENHGYLMHSYPTSLKMSMGDEENAMPDRQPCERCCGKSYDEMPKANAARRQSEFYSSMRETSHVLQNSDKNNMNRSIVRDTMIGGGEVISPGVNVNDRLQPNIMTGTQWFAQGSTTTQYLPSARHINLPVDDNNIRYTTGPVLSTRDNENVQYPQYPVMNFTSGASKYQCIESKSTTNSSQYFAHTGADNNNPTSSPTNPNSNSCHVNSGQCNRVEQMSPLCHTVASSSSMSVQSSTTFHKHCNRPCSLDVTAATTVAQPQPQSAPELPSTFEPFNRLLQTRSIPDNTPTTPTTPSDNYPSYLANCDSTPSSSMSVNNLNHPLGTSNESRRAYTMNVNCARNEPEGASHSVFQRSRSALNVDPVPHYASRNYWGGGGGTVALSPTQQPRSYTSVNLTLRPPSLEPLPPIEIESAGSSLTYSTSSYDPRQGFQSQLQIRIGPGGVGSVSALRTRVPEVRPRSCYAPAALEPRIDSLLRAESMPDVTAVSTDDLLCDQLAALGCDQLHTRTRALLAHQLERRNRLRSELQRDKQKLRVMQREVQAMTDDLARRQLLQRTLGCVLPVTTVLQRVQSLRQEIQFLQTECKKMTTEVDMISSDAHVPLGETDEAFYKNIYTGQRGCVHNRHLTANTQRQEVRNVGTRTSPLEPLEPDGPNWTCSECTFRNHPLLDKCEQCEMPHIILGETQDIHIRVTHHNFPNRRGVLHSWVV